MSNTLNHYRIHGEHGNPDIRKENRYCTLTRCHETISTPRGVKESFGSPWIYGVGLGYPIYYGANNASSIRARLDNSKFNILPDIYAMPNKPVVVNNLESDFQPPIYTPEEAKLVQGKFTKYSR